MNDRQKREEATKAYEDILDLPHKVSTKHPKMSMVDRAAQFSPFAALTGHGAAIKETARITDARIELDEERKEVIRNRLQLISHRYQVMQHGHQQYETMNSTDTNESKEDGVYSITYFRPDTRKEGGVYETVTDSLYKIDYYKRIIITSNMTHIPMDEIINIEGKLFQTMGLE